jgi:hypothetical protein
MRPPAALISRRSSHSRTLTIPAICCSADFPMLEGCTHDVLASGVEHAPSDSQYMQREARCPTYFATQTVPLENTTKLCSVCTVRSSDRCRRSNMFIQSSDRPVGPTIGPTRRLLSINRNKNRSTDDVDRYGLEL